MHKWKYRSLSTSIGPFVIDKTKLEGHFQNYRAFIPSSILSWLPGAVYFLSALPLSEHADCEEATQIINASLGDLNICYTGSEATQNFFFFFLDEEFGVSVALGIRLLVVPTI